MPPATGVTVLPRVIQSLEEAEQARKDFLQLKEKAEFILTQLQVRTGDASKYPIPDTS